jgi:hypothetical protein
MPNGGDGTLGERFSEATRLGVTKMRGVAIAAAICALLAATAAVTVLGVRILIRRIRAWLEAMLAILLPGLAGKRGRAVGEKLEDAPGQAAASAVASAPAHRHRDIRRRQRATPRATLVE